MPPSANALTHIYFAIRTHFEPSCIRAGGIARVINNASRLIPYGIRFHVIAPTHEATAPEVQEHNGVQWHQFVRGSLLGPGAEAVAEGLEFALRLIRQNPNDSEAHLIKPCNLGPDTAKVLSRAAAEGIPSVLPLTMFPEPTNPLSLRDRFRLIRERKWFQPIAAAHTTSNVSARAICEVAGKPSGWARVIRNGVDLRRFHPPATREEKLATKQALGLPTDRPVALFVGGATKRKGVDFLLDAWEQFISDHGPKAVLVMVGGSADRPGVNPSQRHDYLHFADVFARRLKDIQGKADVRFIDHQTTIETYFRAADIFVFPSRHEGLPNTVLEAMASRLTVVTTRFIGFPDEGAELGFEGQHFISLPRDPKVWAATLADLFSNPERREAIGYAARLWMESHQDIEHISVEAAQYFHSLARSHRAGTLDFPSGAGDGNRTHV
ncbi:MAG: glycosyltransferase family 4 protein [Verrucomicrobiaceae bacterium]|nr:glycosyltransferase family 4 protein [Verrucomicrobiaceae bacterium]